MTTLRLAATFLAAGIISINTAFSLTVPFQNITLNPGVKIQADYSFGSQYVIFCFSSNTDIVGNITWPYHNQTQSSTLPVLLKINSQFEGQFADPNGIIEITNTSKSTIQVGCLFAF